MLWCDIAAFALPAKSCLNIRAFQPLLKYSLGCICQNCQKYLPSHIA